jgi:hypothetical protein
VVVRSMPSVYNVLSEAVASRRPRRPGPWQLQSDKWQSETRSDRDFSLWLCVAKTSRAVEVPSFSHEESLSFAQRMQSEEVRYGIADWGTKCDLNAV